MEEKKHSGLGIASFITSIASGIPIFLLFAIAAVIGASTPGGLDEQSVAAVVVGLCLFFFVGVALVALGLGIAGLFQKERKKIFAILGTIFSAATLVGTLILMILGFTMG
jgi:hypothetical protein